MKAFKFIILALLVTACSQEKDEPKPTPVADEISVTHYEINGSQMYRSVEKFVIEGHEYLVFGAKLANPPTVVHNENCPCKK